MPELAAVLAPIGTPLTASELSGGTFSSVQAVGLEDGRTVVVKTSVPDSEEHGALLGYERDLARVERDMLAMLGDADAVPAPLLLMEDFSRSRVEVDVIVSELLPGTPWDRAEGMAPAAEATAGLEIGAIFSHLHQHTGRRFGYPAANFSLGGATWPAAFGAIVHSHLADAERWHVDVRAAEIRAVLARGQHALAAVTTPSLVHNDLWPGNVLLDPASGHVLGVVDWERALYGDPLLDFVGMAAFSAGSLASDHVEGYLAHGGTLPLDPNAGLATGLTAAADHRIALYRLSLLTVMLIEVIPRGFHGDWLADHLALTASTRDEVLEYALATFPAA